MDSRLEAHLTDEIPRLVPGVLRDARRELHAIWNDGRDIPETPSVAFDRDDIEQEMWVAACEREDVLLSHLEADNKAAIREVLKRGAKRMVTAEKREQRAKKAALAGYETHDEVFYTVGALRRLMPMYLDNDKEAALRAPKGRELDVQVSNGGTIHHADYLATIMDVDHAFRSLSLGRQKLLARYFSFPQGKDKDDFRHQEIAGRMGMDPDELSNRVGHALRAMQKTLGGASPWNRGPTPGRGKQ